MHLTHAHTPQIGCLNESKSSSFIKHALKRMAWACMYMCDCVSRVKVQAHLGIASTQSPQASKRRRMQASERTDDPLQDDDEEDALYDDDFEHEVGESVRVRVTAAWEGWENGGGCVQGMRYLGNALRVGIAGGGE